MESEGRYLYSGLGTDEKKPERFLRKIQRQNDNASSFIAGKRYEYRCFCYESVRIENIRKKGEEPTNAVLLLHGGAFLRGSDDFYRKIARDFAAKTNAAIFMPDYSVSPARYPSQIEEIFSVWEYMTSIYHPRNISIVGVGAGANLALILSQYQAKCKMFTPASLVLVAPWVDMEAAGDSYYDKFYLDKVLGKYVVDDPDLPTFVRKSFVYDYLNGRERNDESVSPLYARLYGLPETLIVVGDYSILSSEAESLYRKMISEGVNAKLIVENYEIGEYPLFYKTNAKAKKTIKVIWSFVRESYPKITNDESST